MSPPHGLHEFRGGPVGAGAPSGRGLVTGAATERM
jgi:hypothetical protein